jgi:hypothetical protein
MAGALLELWQQAARAETGVGFASASERSDQKRKTMLPRRREDELVVRELSEETVVYDRRRDKAHCLNRTATLVWRHCDGQTSVAELAKLLHEELGVPADEQLVWHALVRLDKARLLTERLHPAKAGARRSRRELIKMGVAAVAVPVVMTILAPTPATAGPSCALHGQPCNVNANCCSGVCAGGSCV